MTTRLDNRKATIVDVARHAGVAVSTASAAVNGKLGKWGKPAVAPAKYAAVMRAVQDLNFEANSAARSLVTGKSGVIAIWVPTVYDAVYMRVVKCIMDGATEFGMTTAIREGRELTTIGKNSSASPVDGIIGHDTATLLEAYLEATQFPVPVVSVGASYTLNCDTVGIDGQQGAITAARHLIDVGCRHIAYVCSQGHTVNDGGRRHAYLTVCADAAIEPQFVPVNVYNRAHARDQVRSWLEEGHKVDGFFCWNDVVATVANVAAHDCGRRVPDDIAIIGSDGIEEIEFQYPALSTVSQPVEEMVRRALELLQRRLSEPTAELVHDILPMTLVQRDSTKR
ncbi:MAG TPA: LacI family DNA-binding transcriptional regulator [Capsulimonadaceae bacterium]